jgi:FkbM family methyltransferase
MKTNNQIPWIGRLLPSLLRFPIARQWIQSAAHRWARNRDMMMLAGIGVGLRFNSAQSNPAYSVGINEWPVQKWLASNVYPGDVVYDVGANVGFFTLLAARLTGANGHVYAFEPVPENVAAVRHNLAQNHMAHVTVLQQAVSDEVGEGKLLLAHYSGGSSLDTVGSPPDLKGELIVPLTTLDALVVQQNYPQPKFVKIDVEGAEINVLRGMTWLLKNAGPTLMYEIDDGAAAGYEQKRDECAKFLAEQGYEVTELADAYPDIGWYVGHFVARPGGR